MTAVVLVLTVTAILALPTIERGDRRESGPERSGQCRRHRMIRWVEDDIKAAVR